MIIWSKSSQNIYRVPGRATFFMFLELKVKSFSGPCWVQWTKVHDTTNFGTGTFRSRDFPQGKKLPGLPMTTGLYVWNLKLKHHQGNVPQRSISPMGIQDSGMNEKYRESCTSSKWWFPYYLWDIFTGPLEVQSLEGYIRRKWCFKRAPLFIAVVY